MVPVSVLLSNDLIQICALIAALGSAVVLGCYMMLRMLYNLMLDITEYYDTQKAKFRIITGRSLPTISYAPDRWHKDTPRESVA